MNQIVRTTDEEYVNHAVFGLLGKAIELYDRMSISCMSWCAKGTSGLIHYDTYVYLAMKGTLESIDTLLKLGRISDAVTLIRKFYDDVLVDIYLSAVGEDNCIEMPRVEELELWLRKKHRIPTLKNVLKIIKTSPSTKGLYPYFDWDSNLKRIREYFDDFVHSNRYGNVLMNCADILVKGRLEQLNSIQFSINEIIRLHLSFMFYLNSEFFMASNYIDSLDCGFTPLKGSERWISPYAQEAFDSFIKPNNALCLFIKEHSFLEIE